MQYLNRITLLLLLSLFAGCTLVEEDKFILIDINDEVSVSSDFILLKGKFQNPDKMEIVEMGIEYFKGASAPDFQNEHANSISANKVLLNFQGMEGSIEGKIEDILYANTNYAARFYIISNHRTFYSPLVYFKSVEMGVIFETPVNLKVTWGDTLEVKGRKLFQEGIQFNFKIINTKEQSQTYQLNPIYKSDSLIRFVLPLSHKFKTFKLELFLANEIVYSDFEYSLKDLVIKSVSNTQFFPGDEVTIMGNNLHPTENYISIFGESDTLKTVFSKKVSVINDSTVKFIFPYLDKNETLVFRLQTFQSPAITFDDAKGIQNKSLIFFEDIISPVDIGDSIFLTGKNFLEYDFQVLLGSQTLSFKVHNDGLIAIATPLNFVSYQLLQVKFNSYTKTFNKYYSSIPVMTSITDESVWPGDTIIIYGEHFNPFSPSQNKIRLFLSSNPIKHSTLSAFEATRTYCKFAIPSSYSYPHAKLQLLLPMYFDGSWYSPNSYIITPRPPFISGIDKQTARLGEEVTITGDFLHHTYFPAQIYINGIKQETTFISENEVRYKVTGCDLTDNNIYVPELIRGGSSTTLDPINLLNKAPTILSVDKTFARPGELLTITFNNDININVLSSCNFYLDIDGIFVNNYTIIDNQTITIDVPEVYKNLNPEIILNWNGSSYNTGKLLNVVTPWTQYDLVPDAFNGNSLIHINHLSFVINDNFYFGAYKKYVSDSLFIYRYNIPQKSLSEEIFFGKIPPYPNDFKTDGNQMYYIHSDSLFSFNLSTKSHTFLSNIPVDQPSRNLRMDISNGKIAIGLGNSTSDFNMKNTKLFIYDIAGQFWEVKDGNFSNFPQDIFYINNELKAFGSNPVRVENYNSVSDTWNTEVIANPLFSAYYLLNHAVLNNKCYFSIENHDGSKTNYMRLAIYDNLNNSLKLLEQGPPNNDSITRPAILFTYNNELYYLTWSYEVGYYKTIYKFDDTKVP